MQGLGRDTQNRDSPKREKDLRGSAILHQQRRLKQATQFVHQDSADLLPLDQLRRLGTSKDLQPHSVIQRRLMGGSLSIESDNPVFPTSPCNRGRDAPPRVMRRYSQLSWVRRPPVAGRNKLYSYPARAPISHYKVASGLYGPRNDTDWSLEFTVSTGCAEGAAGLQEGDWVLGSPRGGNCNRKLPERGHIIGPFKTRLQRP
ncbi:hypothetical protein XENTR_v10020232 [Xenopus tropicalis]|uniref:Uncharacterized protein LOC101734838 isoform X2 n=1 Tax=Xenopus tropicalis TaxID=8364 RepID=A0A8J1IR83_XENTR|nr:uncharacterized protein LOC105945772 isoform X2 [Xenopus tropicalis]XP_031748103.1 uncharacterized protein LOC101734838 isoform X2 [Xenopus tropicalis]KAE8582744.1 hypothetical protein XENTR_v10020232 [Xenopus tropicalis]|eukprot:XP_017945926.1 PREDICTED: uncharacterized protein LOC101734063 isoform X1 [Xenopus tropicalis]